MHGKIRAKKKTAQVHEIGIRQYKDEQDSSEQCRVGSGPSLSLLVSRSFDMLF